MEEIELDTLQSLSDDTFNTEDVYLVSGLAYHQAFDDRYVTKKPGTVHKVPGGAIGSDDLDEILQTD